MNEKLSILDESSDSEVEFKINKNYADRYNVWRSKEELQKYKDLKKEDDDSETSSESEEDIPECDEEFLRALSLLKGKDPRIYDKNYELFKSKEVKKNKTVKEKPMFMKDYERNLVLERGGNLSDDEEHIPAKGPTYDEQQEDLKKSFKALVENSDDEDDDLLQVRSKTHAEEEDDEADYLKWLKGEEVKLSEDAEKDLSYLKNYWNDPKLDEGEKFLRDYILNRKYLEKDDAEIPTYEEITSGALSDEEKMIEEHEKFEHKYNFRFEEPDEEFIKRYPRTVGDSLRKGDNRRKQKREDKTERRRREREQRREELKRLKALKRKEIEERFLKLKEVSGQDEINLNESDMESDFDPDKHDIKMREMFNDDYYEVEEIQKPEFPYDEELDSENWNTWTGERIVSDDDEVREDYEMDSHENIEIIDQPGCSTNSKEGFEKEMIEATLPKKKVKKKSLFAKIISQTKPIYDPNGKSFDDYLDEYYKLDYEDVIGDMPVRYKYRKVVPNDFGLTVDEILTAQDRELNRWCSVKKTCQYRNDDEEMYDVQAYKKKSQNISTKTKVFSSLYGPKETDNELNTVFEQKNENENERYSSGEATNDIFASSQDEMVTEEDVTKSHFNDNMKQEINQDSFTQSIELKKKKRKKKSLNSNMSPDSKTIGILRNVDSDSNKNSLEMSDHCHGEQKTSDNETISYNKHQNKSNKKKQKEKYDTLSNIKPEPQYINLTNKSIDIEAYSSVLESNLKSSKSIKRKRKTCDNEFSASEINVDKNNLKKNLNKAKQSTLSNMNNSASSFDSNFVSKSLSQELVKKKHKKNKKYSCGAAMNDTFTSSQDEMTEEDVIKSNFSNNIELEIKQESFTQSNEHKKKKRKRKSLNSNLNTESKIIGTLRNVDSDSDKSDLEMFDSVQCQGEQKTSNDTISCNKQQNTSNKRKHEETLFNMKDSATSLDSNFVSEGPSAELVVKKKKKKCKKNKKGTSDIASTNNIQHKSKTQRFKDKKYVENVSGDKRLVLSDERLAAYGINPKKFKNKILYSKK